MTTINRIGSGSWSDAANWSPMVVPGVLDEVILNTSPTLTVSGAGVAGSLRVNGVVDLLGTTSVANGVNVDGGVLTIGPGATVTTPGRFSTGGIYGQNFITIQGTLSDSSAEISGIDQQTDVTITGSGALWSSTGNVHLPIGARLTVMNGGVFQATALTLDSGGAVNLLPGGVVAGTIVDGGDITVGGFQGATQSGTLASVAAALVVKGGVSGNPTSRRVWALPGFTVQLGGPISGPATDDGAPNRLSLMGSVKITSADNSFAGNLAINVGQVVLAAHGAAGTAPIQFLPGPGSLALQAGATGNPDGSTTILAGAGADTVSLVDAPALIYGSAGALTVYNGARTSTVYGGSGPTTLFGGAGGGVFYGGLAGGNVIVAGAAPVTIGGGGSNDQLFAGATGTSLLAAAAGNATLSAAGSTGNNILFGGGGPNMIATGAGTDLVVAGSGATTVTAGSGDAVVFTGSGADVVVCGGGVDYVQIGSGTSAIFAGAGPDLFAAFNGAAGGAAIITGFKPGVDHIALRGYGAGPVVSTAGGNATLTLSDNTRLTLVGVTSLPQGTLQ